MKKNISKIIFIGIVTIVCSMSVIVFAKESDTEEQIAEDCACALNVEAEGIILTDAYKDFLFNLTKSSTPSSDTIRGAVQYYRYIDDVLNTELAKTSSTAYNATLGIGTAEFTYCNNQKTQIMTLAESIMLEYIGQSSSNKNNFMLVDALKIVNQNTEEYSNIFNGLFPVVFQKLDNNLTCFAKSCVHK